MTFELPNTLNVLARKVGAMICYAEDLATLSPKIADRVDADGNVVEEKASVCARLYAAAQQQKLIVEARIDAIVDQVEDDMIDLFMGEALAHAVAHDGMMRTRCIVAAKQAWWRSKTGKMVNRKQAKQRRLAGL